MVTSCKDTDDNCNTLKLIVLLKRVQAQPRKRTRTERERESGTHRCFEMARCAGKERPEQLPVLVTATPMGAHAPVR